MTHQYQITGMTCGHCVAKVKKELLHLADVVTAEVTLQSPQATISMTKHIETVVLQQAISKAGNYTITEYAHDKEGTSGHSKTKGEGSSYFPTFLVFGLMAGIGLLVQASRDSLNWVQ